MEVEENNIQSELKKLHLKTLFQLIKKKLKKKKKNNYLINKTHLIILWVIWNLYLKMRDEYEQKKKNF